MPMSKCIDYINSPANGIGLILLFWPLPDDPAEVGFNNIGHKPGVKFASGLL
jgi:hypothetical protein